jgi:hypothetical protein
MLLQLMNLSTVRITYGDDEHSAPFYELPAFSDDMAARREKTWWCGCMSPKAT